jgi:hypothetical protein
MGLAGTPSNMGKVGDAALADADPLGVNQNVTFDEVGGLDDRKHFLPLIDAYKKNLFISYFYNRHSPTERDDSPPFAIS